MILYGMVPRFDIKVCGNARFLTNWEHHSDLGELGAGNMKTQIFRGRFVFRAGCRRVDVRR